MLPKINAPTFSLKLPSNNQKIVYRPFQVKEEKILLIAQKSDNSEDQFRAIKQILKNCVIEPETFDPEEIASFDMEYLFLKLRAKSVGEIVTVNILPQDREDLPAMETTINIDELEPTFDKDHTDIIELSDSIRIKMKYPTVSDLSKIDSTNQQENILFDILRDCMEIIYVDGEAYQTKDHSKKELDEFIESFTSNQFANLQNFFTTLPKIKKDIVYKWVNPNDSNDKYEEKVTIQGLLSFLS
jgi:hypothetical protein